VTLEDGLAPTIAYFRRVLAGELGELDGLTNKLTGELTGELAGNVA